MAAKTGSLIFSTYYGVVNHRLVPCGAGCFVHSVHAARTKISRFHLLERCLLLHTSNIGRASARKSGAFKRAVQVVREEESRSDSDNVPSPYQPLVDDTRLDKRRQEDDFMSIPFLRPDLAISSARRRPKKVMGQTLPGVEQDYTDERPAEGMQTTSMRLHETPAVHTTSEHEIAEARMRDLKEQQEAQEIRKLVEDSVNSAHLFRPADVEGPLTGSLLPIRPRKHRWTPMHLVAADRDDELHRNLESGRPNTLKVKYERYLNAYYWFTYDSFIKWLDRRRTRKIIKRQSLDPVKLRELGPELCAADMVFTLGGRVKFYGVDRWYNAQEAELMPSRFSEQISLEAIDLTNTEVTYEGLENLVGLKSLRWLSLQRCQRLDDFCMPRLFSVHRTLEFLDLSGCQNITDRGLGWLHHMENLKLVKVENMPNAPNVNLVALQLEDTLPLCEFQGVSYNNPLHLDTPTVDLPNLPATEPVKIAEDDDEEDLGNEELWKKKSMVAQPGIVEVGNPKYGEIEAKRKLRNRLGPLYSAHDKHGNEKFG